MSDQTQKTPTRPSDLLEPVHAGKTVGTSGSWAEYLVLFLRIMAGVSLVKGLYHWAQVCGIGAPADGGFESHTAAWQTATVFFAGPRRLPSWPIWGADLHQYHSRRLDTDCGPPFWNLPCLRSILVPN
jgi:hypothetical protein